MHARLSASRAPSVRIVGCLGRMFPYTQRDDTVYVGGTIKRENEREVYCISSMMDNFSGSVTIVWRRERFTYRETHNSSRSYSFLSYNMSVIDFLVLFSLNRPVTCLSIQQDCLY